jgi:hypothetical protein
VLAVYAVCSGLDAMTELAIDPNEPLYCTCRQVSFGHMVACDDPDVSAGVSVSSPFRISAVFFCAAGSHVCPSTVCDRVVPLPLCGPGSPTTGHMVLSRLHHEAHSETSQETVQTVIMCDSRLSTACPCWHPRCRTTKTDGRYWNA